MTGKKAAAPKQQQQPCKPKAKKGKSKTPKVETSPAPQNVGVRVTGTAKKSISDAGTDQLFQTSVNSKKTGIITQVVISPTLLPRLGRIAGGFQRITYHRLRFEIVTGTPTTCGGVYVAGFVKDAVDPITHSTASATLLASGGTATKFWQSVDVVVNNIPGLFYTSANTSEPRWSSPGSLVVAVVAPPTQAVDIQIFVHWSVTLSQPTYEDPNATAFGGFHAAKINIFTKAGEKSLSCRGKTGDHRYLKPEDFSPPLANGVSYRLSAFKFTSVENSNKALEGVFGFCRIEVHTTGQDIYPIDDRGNASALNFNDSVQILQIGETVSAEPAENLYRAPWFLSASNPCVPLEESLGRLSCRPGSPTLSGLETQSTCIQPSSEDCMDQLQHHPEASPSDHTSMLSESSSQRLLNVLTGLLSMGTTFPSQVSQMESRLKRLESSRKFPSHKRDTELDDYELVNEEE